MRRRNLDREQARVNAEFARVDRYAAEDTMKKLLMKAAVKAVANGGFTVTRVPPRADAPPRPDLAPVGRISKFWIVPPHTGLTRDMLPEGPKL